ncbi:hypothetical protein [Streptomyces sp. NPDC003006]
MPAQIGAIAPSSETLHAEAAAEPGRDRREQTEAEQRQSSSRAVSRLVAAADIPPYWRVVSASGETATNGGTEVEGEKYDAESKAEHAPPAGRGGSGPRVKAARPLSLASAFRTTGNFHAHNLV